VANPNPSPATRFKKGDIPNPGGRPRGRSVTARLRDLLDRPAPGADGKKKRGGPPAADALAEVILRAALDGDFRFVKEVLDRTEGVVRAAADPDEDGPPEQPKDGDGNPIED
jgi:hypothetical protein